MIQPALIVIGKLETDHVSLEITDWSDDRWLAGTLEVQAGPWSGCCSISLFEGELRLFADDLEVLYRDLVGQAALSHNHQLRLTLKGNGRGLITVEGSARDTFTEPTYLAFALALDQTELPPIIAALRAADPK